MTRLWNLIEAHYLIAAFLVWAIVEELSKIVRSLLRTIQLHPDHITHNHHNYDNSTHGDGDTEDDEDEDEETDTGPTSSPNPMLTQPRPQPILRPGRRVEPVSSPGLLTRAERVIRNLRGGPHI